MKQNFINTDKINNSKTLKQITSRILKIVDVERIYLNKGAREHAFEYRLNIITSQLSKDIASQIYPVIEMIFEEYPNYAYRFFSLQFVNQELYNGNLFFLNNCSDEELVYENLHSNSHWAYPLLNYHKVYEKAKSDFKKDICKIKSLKEGIKFYLSRNDFSQTAFMIHQTYEITYRVLECFIIGRPKICHKISNHQTYLNPYIKNLKGMYEKDIASDKELLLLLDEAYSSSRYTHTYKISKEQVKILKCRVAIFVKDVERLFEQELLKFRKMSYFFNVNKQKENLQIKESKKSFNKDAAKLNKIKELSKDNFVLMRPIVGVREGYYLKYVRVKDYFELFYTLKSMLNVCILALDGQTDSTRNIKDVKSEVKSVLEFAKHLIPLEEGHYLDEMRKLMITDEDSTHVA